MDSLAAMVGIDETQLPLWGSAQQGSEWVNKHACVHWCRSINQRLLHHRLLKSSILKEKAKLPAGLAIKLKFYSGRRVCRGGRADKKSVHAEHLMSSAVASSPKRQLPLEMPPSTIARSQWDLTFLPNAPLTPSQMLLDLTEVDGNWRLVRDVKIRKCVLETGDNNKAETGAFKRYYSQLGFMKLL